MKTFKTIRTYKTVWEIMRDMQLDGLLTGIQDGQGNIELNGLLNGLLLEGKAIEFFQAITRSDVFMENAESEPVDWEDVEAEILLELVKDFFGITAGTWAGLRRLGSIAAGAAADARSAGTPSPGSATTSQG